MWEVSIYIQIGKTCPKTLDRRYAYIIECQKKSGKLHRKGNIKKITGTLHQTTLTAIGEAMGRITQSCMVYIYTEDRFVSNMFASNIDKWAGNGWMRSEGRGVENRAEWEAFWKLTKGKLVRMVPGKHVYSDWMKEMMNTGLGIPEWMKEKTETDLGIPK